MYNSCAHEERFSSVTISDIKVASDRIRANEYYLAARLCALFIFDAV